MPEAVLRKRDRLTGASRRWFYRRHRCGWLSICQRRLDPLRQLGSIPNVVFSRDEPRTAVTHLVWVHALEIDVSYGMKMTIDQSAREWPPAGCIATWRSVAQGGELLKDKLVRNQADVIDHEIWLVSEVP